MEEGEIVENNTVKHKKGLTYHWAIVLACFLMMGASVGITVNCFSVFSVGIIKTFGFSASQVVLINSIGTLANLITGVFIAKIFAKLSVRKTTILFAIITSVGFICYSFAKTLVAFYIVAAVVGFGITGVSTIPCGLLLNNWFDEKKGTATGIAFTGSVFCGLIFVQVAKSVLASSGLQRAYVVLGICCAVILIPTTLFLVRAKPSEKGLLPYGAQTKDALDAKAAAVQQEVTGISFGKYVKTSSFWLTAISLFLLGGINMGIQNNFTVYFTSELGHTAEFAANIFTINMGVQIVGKLLLGAIYDKKGLKFGSIYGCVLYFLVVISMIMSKNTTIAILCGCVFGLLCSMTTVTPPYLVSLNVGRKAYAQIYGVLCLFYGAGIALLPLVASSIYDKTSSYNLAWYIFAGCSVVLAITTIVSNKKSKGFAEMTE